MKFPKPSTRVHIAPLGKDLDEVKSDGIQCLNWWLFHFNDLFVGLGQISA
jgi:hypothetical protein